MKNTKFLFVLSLLGASVLTACDGHSDQKSSEPVTPESSIPGSGSVAPESSIPSSEKKDHFIDTPVEITFWSNSSYTAEIEDIIKRFKEVEPNVTVTHTKQTGGYDDVKNMIVQGIPANNYPDLYLGYPDSVQEIMNYGKVVQLDPYMDNADYGWTEEDKDDIVAAYLAEGQSYPVDGTWSLPAAKSTEGMYYNKDVLIGLDLSGFDSTINGGNPLNVDYLNNLTWEELFNKLCPAIEKYNNSLAEDKKIYKTDYNYHAIFGYDSDDNVFITLAEQYGYGYTSVDKTTGKGKLEFNNDGMKGIMKTLNDAGEKGYLMTKGMVGNYTNYAFTAHNALFSIGSTGGIKYQIDEKKSFETGVAKIPHAEGRDPSVINQGPSMSILDHSDDNRALASWLFYKFFSNKQNDLYWSTQTGYSPLRYSTYETSEYSEYMDPSGKEKMSLEKLTAEVASYNASVANDLYISPVFKGSATARTQVGSIVTQVMKTKKAELTDEKLDSIFQSAIDETLKKM